MLPPLPLVPEPLALMAPVTSMSTSAVSITMPPQPPCLLVPLTSSGPTVMLAWMASRLSVPLMVMGPTSFMRQMSPPPPCAAVPETSMVPSIVMAPLAISVNQPLGPWSLPPAFTLMVFAEMVMTRSPATSSMSPPEATTRSHLLPLNAVKSSVLPALTLARPVTVHWWVLVSQSHGWCPGLSTEQRADIGVGGSVVVVVLVVVVVVLVVVDVVLVVVVVVVVSATAGTAPRASTTRRGAARRMPPAATRVPKGGAPGARAWTWQPRRIAQG